MKLVEYFDLYTTAGLKTIPLFPQSKVPIWDAWNNQWDADRCRKACLKYPLSNLGLLLGEIVDVEGDSEEANAFLNQLIGECPHPSYRSSKSVHHLFINPDPNLTLFKFNNIEFRGFKHQSAIPPSHHENGSKYVWLSTTKFPVPAMPPSLLNYYHKIQSLVKTPKLKPKHIKPWCSKCRHKKYIHKKRYNLEILAFRELNLPWQCRVCRSVDLRARCRKLRCC